MARANYRCIIATSARALSCFPPRRTGHLRSARLMPLLLVGERTREAALERALKPHVDCAGRQDSRHSGLHALRRPSHFVYLAGRDRKPDSRSVSPRLDLKSSRSKSMPAACRIFKRRCLALPKQAASGGVALSGGARRIPRPRADSRSRLSRINHICISQEAAAPLLDARLNGVLIAEAPNEQAMFEIVNTLTDPP